MKVRTTAGRNDILTKLARARSGSAMFRVKICGINRLEDARVAADAGADAIGLNFYAGSPRCCPLERAREIAGATMARGRDAVGISALR